MKRLAVIGGDSTGPEVVVEALKCLRAVADKTGFEYETESFDWGGDRVIYCGDYLQPDHPQMQMSKEELFSLYLPSIKKVNPDFDRDWVRTSYLFREKYAQPVPPVNHSKNIPPLETPIPGLYFASMSQVYPWDRGTNYAVEIGRRAAGLVLKDRIKST